MISRIKITNFKSFAENEVILGRFNLIIGANSAGKTNLLQIFRFIHDIAVEGLRNAIFLQGGSNYLPNLRLKQEETKLEFDTEYPTGIIAYDKRKAYGIKLSKLNYAFSFKFIETEPRFEITSDVATFDCTIVELDSKNNEIVVKKEYGKGKLTLTNKEGQFHFNLETETTKISLKDEHFRSPFMRTDLEIPHSTLMLNSRHFPPFLDITSDLLSKISVHDFQPKVAKSGVPYAGRTDLEETGVNLPVILKSILSNEKERTQLLMILRDTFPFAEDLDVKEFASESYMIWMKESKIPKEYIPATLMSEGTIRVTALIVLLYFRQQPIVLIEEPERNIHPYLISKVAKMLVESSEDIQILATTHNPLIVKYVDPKDILLVKRNNKGFSEIIRPIEKDKIKQFLEHDMGLDELFVGNLLG